MEVFAYDNVYKLAQLVEHEGAACLVIYHSIKEIINTS